MKEIEKILALLENEDASIKELYAAAENNAEAIEFINAHEKILEIYNSQHLNIDDLTNYILHKNNMQPEDEGIVNKVPAIRKHLSNCNKCKDEYNILAEELSEIDKLLKNGAYKKDELKTSLAAPKTSFNFFRYAAMIIIVPMLIITASYLFRPGAFKFTSIDNSEELYTTRGRNANDFLKAAESIDNKNYQEAINYLNSDISTNPNDETVFYSYYLTGLLNLELSESSFIGLFKSYDQEKVSNAIAAFDECIKKNNSGKYKNVNLDAEFYLGKAYLMLSDIDEAKIHFSKVVEGKGSKIEEAGDILQSID